MYPHPHPRIHLHARVRQTFASRALRIFRYRNVESRNDYYKTYNNNIKAIIVIIILILINVFIFVTETQPIFSDVLYNIIS